MYMITVE
jgi:hypothetical protein